MGVVNLGMFTSTTGEWPTPAAFFAALHEEFGFTLDPCATAENAKCPDYYTKEDDGLTKPWDGVVFVNPPYGRGINLWVERAWHESRRGSTVVMLIPARTDTAYWHDYAMRSSEIRFIRGRLDFFGARSKGHNAPFPSAVVVFRPGCEGPPVVSSIDRGVRD